MQINGFLTIYNSRADMYGNRYWALLLFNPDTGHEAHGTISAENVQTQEAREVLKWHITRTELPIREFNRLTKKWPHLGCQWDTMRDLLVQQLESEKLAELAGLIK